MDGTVRDVQHLIMLGVLPAQSTDESAPFAPGDPHRFHDATFPPVRELAPEEPPSLPVRSPSTRAALPGRPSALTECPDVLGVRARQLPDPEGQDERDGAVEVPGVPLLDQVLELVPQGHRDLDRGGGRRHRRAYESPDRVGTRPEFVVGSELFEVRLLLGREANTEKVGRGSFGSSGPHAVKQTSTSITTFRNEC